MFISCKAQSELDFDSLVADLCRAFPGTSAISDDFYASRLAAYVEIARQQGMALDCAPIRCVKRLSSEHGVQRHIVVAVTDSLSFNARIDKLGALLVTQDSADVDDAEPVLTILRRYPLEIETS